MLILIGKVPIYRKPYEYYLLTWGGFYNEEHQIEHKFESGDHYFMSEKSRDGYLASLRTIEEDLNARHLASGTHEGFTCHERTVLHRVIEYAGIKFYSRYDIGVGYDYSSAAYHMEWKWYPGFNDYPLGEDFDYTDVEIISEWITGAFVQHFKDNR